MPANTPSARAIAVAVLTDVTEHAAYANIALREALSRNPRLDARDKALVTELTNATLRNLLQIDCIIDAFAATPVSRMKPFIRNLLRISVCQLRFLDRIPPSATVNEAVALTKARGFTPLAGFVNGVLRSIGRNPEKPTPPPNEPLAPYLSYQYSYPLWLVESLIRWLGSERAAAFCAESHISPPVTVCVNTNRITPAQLAERLRNEGVDCEPGLLFPECLRLRRTADITKLPSFNDGLFHVIDEGALAAVHALSLQPGQSMIDLCAAPGGKAFAAAYRMQDRGRLLAFDIHEHKIKLINEMARRLGVTCINTTQQDARIVDDALKHSADAVLLDAPCSGLGIIRKQPDIKYARKPEDIASLSEMQRAMLATAADYVKPGGVLVYCVCTITPDEGIDTVKWFTDRYPFTVEVPPANEQPYTPSHYVENNCLQLLPGLYNDAFFVARLKRAD